MRRRWLWLFFLPRLAFAGGPGGVERLTRAFIDDVEHRRFDVALERCAEPFRSRPSLSCRRLLRDIEEEEPGAVKLTPASFSGDEDSGVALVWATYKQETALFWFLGQRGPDGWRFVDGSDGETAPPRAHKPAPLRLLDDRDEPMTAVLRALRDGVGLLERCTAEMQAAKDDGCPELAAGVANGVSFVAVGMQQRHHRAAVTTWVVKGNKPVDLVYVYLQQTDGAWQIAGVDEAQNHVMAWLSGTLPAHFGPEAWAEDPTADRLFAQLAARAQGLTSDGPAWPGVQPPAELKLVWARRLVGTDRYAVCATVLGQTAFTTWREVDGSFEQISQGYSMPGRCFVGARDLGQ